MSDLDHKSDRELLVLLVERVSNVQDRITNIESWFVGLQKRVNKLEHWRTMLAGAWGAVVLAAGGIYMVYKDFFAGKDR